MITRARIKDLSDEGYFSRTEQAACMAIMPFVKPEFIGVEIGVYGCDSSRVFLDHCKFMFLIDACSEYADNPDKGWFTVEAEMRETMKPYEGRFTFIKGFSADVAPQIPMVDFVFVDGCHEFEYVKSDIELYWPKVRAGGFLSGHDYGGGHDDVIRAVDEFVAREKLKLEVHQHCWLIQKIWKN